MANLALIFDILAKDGASGAFRNVGDAAEHAGKKTSTFGTAMSGAMKLASSALLGAGLVEGFKALYNAAAESQRIGRLTEQVIKTTGGAANVSAKQVGDLAGAIAKKTGVDDEAIQSGQNLLLTFMNVKNEVGSGNDIFNQATQTITDMSVALGQDTSSSAIQLGKALNDPIKGVTALQRVGVSFTASQKEQIKTLVASGDVLGAQKIILAELGKEFGGAAEAASTPLGKLQQRIGDLAEKVGGYLVPAVDKAATFFMDKLLPAFDAVGPAIGALVSLTGTVASAVGDVVKFFAGLPGPVLAGVGALVAFNLLSGPVALAATGIGVAWLTMTERIAASTGVLGVARAAMGGLVGFLGGPWGIAIAGATVGLGFLVAWLGKSDDHTKEVTQATQDYAGALRSANGVINESVRAAAAKAAQDAGLLDIAERVGVALPDVTSAITDQGGALTRTRGQLEEFIASHTRLVTVQTGKGGAPVATEQLDSEGKAALAALDALNKLSGQTTTTQGDQAQLATATTEGATSMQTFAQQTDDARSALDEAKQAIDDYKLSLDILTGNTVSMLQVESQLNDAVAAGKDAMDKMGGASLTASGALNLQTENGRKAADVLLDVRNSGNDLIATMMQQGATADDVAKKDAGLRASFIHTAGEMGITGRAAETLADQILGIPAERNSKITADTGQASSNLAYIQQQLDGIRSKTITVTAVGVHVGSPLGGGTIPERAAGGPVWPGQSFLVGEKGPELVQFGAKGFVTPNDRTREALMPPALSVGSRSAGQASSSAPSQFVGNLYLDSGEFLGMVRGEATRVAVGALTGATNRGRYNP